MPATLDHEKHIHLFRRRAAGCRPPNSFTGGVHFVAQRLPAQLLREVRGSR